MRNYFKKAVDNYGNTVDNLIQMLETRLDAMVLRGGLAPTIYAARQFVSHGHILVNGKRVNLPSYNLKVGDVVSVREKSRKIPAFSEAMESIKLLYLPKREEVQIICEVSLVIEYYWHWVC